MLRNFPGAFRPLRGSEKVPQHFPAETKKSGTKKRGFFGESETTAKIKFAFFRGVGRGAERKIVQNAIFHGKRHDNKILKVKYFIPCPIYDWTTGVPDNGNEWRKFRAVPRLYPLCSLVLYIV